MISKIIKLVIKKKTFLSYAFLIFLDKGLTFSLPLILFHLYNDRGLYNELEYIYSNANILSIFVGLSLPYYAFYYYRKHNGEKDKLDKFSEANRLSSILFLLIVSVILVLINYISETGISVLLLLMTIIRSVYLSITLYLTAYFRLIDRINNIFYFTTIANVLTLGLVFLVYSFNITSIFSLFVFQLIFSLFFLCQIKILDFINLFRLVKESICFIWPSIVVVFIWKGIHNFGKIYAFSNLSDIDMSILSYIQRTSLIIQLSHTSINGYLAKRLFMESVFFNYSVFKKYLVVIISVAFLVLILILLSSDFIIKVNLFNHLAIVLFLVLYTVFWCIGAYFELFFTKFSKPIYTLINLIPCCIFYVLYLLLVEKSILNITLGMLIFAIIYAFVGYFNLKKIIKKSV